MNGKFGCRPRLCHLAGPRNPYPGKLRFVEEEAIADLLLVDGDPITSIKLIEDPAKSFLVIMKDGKIYKTSPGTRRKVSRVSPVRRTESFK